MADILRMKGVCVTPHGAVCRFTALSSYRAGRAGSGRHFLGLRPSLPRPEFYVPWFQTERGWNVPAFTPDAYMTYDEEELDKDEYQKARAHRCSTFPCFVAACWLTPALASRS
jgi:hypothetical protein